VRGTLSSPLRLGSSTIRNRVYRAPVLEGAGSGPDAAETYANSFVPNARHGVGLIIQGSACLYEEGRTSPGMTLVHSRERMLAMTDMVRAVHDAGAAIFLQIGHGGIYAMEGWHEPYASERKGPLLASSPVPLMLRPSFRGVPVHVMTTDAARSLSPERRRRGLGPRGGLRRHPARFGECQAARPVPLALLQPPHRRVRRIPRAAGAHPSGDS